MGGAEQHPGSRLLLLLQLQGSEVSSIGVDHDYLQHLAGLSQEQLSSLVKLQHLEERISEQDLPIVLDVGQLVDIHSADGGHDAAGKLSPVEGQVFFVQPDDVIFISMGRTALSGCEERKPSAGHRSTLEETSPRRMEKQRLSMGRSSAARNLRKSSSERPTPRCMNTFSSVLVLNTRPLSVSSVKLHY